MTAYARDNLLMLFNPAMPGIAPLLTANGTISTSSASITMAANLPAWVVNGMPVYDTTNSQYLGLVSSTSTTTLTLQANAAHAGSGTTDVLAFGFTPSDVVQAEKMGCDLAGVMNLLILKTYEAQALLSFITTDIITSGQDSAANTILGNASTNFG